MAFVVTIHTHLRIRHSGRVHKKYDIIYFPNIYFKNRVRKFEIIFSDLLNYVLEAYRVR